MSSISLFIISALLSIGSVILEGPGASASSVGKNSTGSSDPGGPGEPIEDDEFGRNIQHLNGQLNLACSSERVGEYRASIASELLKRSGDAIEALKKKTNDLNSSLYEVMTEGMTEGERKKILIQDDQQIMAARQGLRDVVDELENLKRMKSSRAAIAAQRHRVIEAKMILDRANLKRSSDSNSKPVFTPHSASLVRQYEARLSNYARTGDQLDIIHSRAWGCYSTAAGTAKAPADPRRVNSKYSAGGGDFGGGDGSNEIGNAGFENQWPNTSAGSAASNTSSSTR